MATGASLSAVNAIAQKSTIHLRQLNKQELTESQTAVASMWNAAVDAQKAPTEAKDLPFHFDLVGLAEGLSKTATTAQKVQKLSNHVKEAKKTLEQHKRHVAEIEELVKKAEGDQQKELTTVLDNAKQHVQELEQTVSKAETEVQKEMAKEEQEKQAAAGNQTEQAKPDATHVQTQADAKIDSESAAKSHI